MSWYTKQSSDLFKTASNDAELRTYDPSMLRRQSLLSERTVLNRSLRYGF